MPVQRCAFQRYPIALFIFIIILKPLKVASKLDLPVIWIKLKRVLKKKKDKKSSPPLYRWYIRCHISIPNRFPTKVEKGLEGFPRRLHIRVIMYSVQ